MPRCGRPSFDGLLSGFGNTADADINVGDGVPGWVVGVAGRGQVKDALEGAYSVSGCRTVDAVGADAWDGREVAGDTVELLL